MPITIFSYCKLDNNYRNAVCVHIRYFFHIRCRTSLSIALEDISLRELIGEILASN